MIVKFAFLKPKSAITFKIRFMKSLLFHLTVLLFVLTTNTSCINNDEEVKQHKQHKQLVEAFREQKNEDYKIPEKTMLTAELMKDFKGLKYFPIDYKYKVKAQLTKLENLPKIKIKTSTGLVADYVIYGKLSFKIDEKAYELSVYQVQD